jgi:hypothetical protein
MKGGIMATTTTRKKSTTPATQAPPGRKELVAERLILLNDEGYARIGNGGTIGLTRLMICDDHGKIGIDLKLTERGEPALSFLHRGVCRAALGCVGDEVGLALYDKEGKPRTTVTVTAEGLPQLSFRDAAGKERTRLGLTGKGDSMWVMTDDRKRPRLTLMTIKDDPTLWVLDKKGRVVWDIAESNPPPLPTKKGHPREEKRAARKRGRTTARAR